MLSLTRELAVIHARENIRVNALCPGPLRTELLMKVLDTMRSASAGSCTYRWAASASARRSLGRAVLLASDESSFMTGAELVVDGGITSAHVTPG